MTVMITGAGGHLGVELVTAFSDRTIAAFTHEELDITDEMAVWDAVSGHSPSIVVNAAAWTDVEGCQRDRAQAHRVNALGPWWLARACAASGATLVHISAEHVFGGEAHRDASGSVRAWSEFDPVSPISEYGRSKAAGEQLIRQTLPAHHIVRTAWLDGGHGSSSVRRLLERAEAGDPLRVAANEVGSPTFARDLAVAIRELAVTGRYGTVNRTSEGSCSRVELAEAILADAEIDAALEPAAAGPADGHVRHPTWSVFDPCHAVASGLSPLPEWRRSLRRLLSEIGAMPTGG